MLLRLLALLVLAVVIVSETVPADEPCAALEHDGTVTVDPEECVPASEARGGQE